MKRRGFMKSILAAPAAAASYVAAIKNSDAVNDQQKNKCIGKLSVELELDTRQFEKQIRKISELSV